MKKFFYRVEKNDDLFSVSEKLGVPLNSIVSLNALTSPIEEGDLLVVEKKDFPLYEITAGDTIFSVSKKFGVSESDIVEENGREYFFVWQKIYIPKK